MYVSKNNFAEIKSKDSSCNKYESIEIDISYQHPLRCRQLCTCILPCVLLSDQSSCCSVLLCSVFYFFVLWVMVMLTVSFLLNNITSSPTSKVVKTSFHCINAFRLFTYCRILGSYDFILFFNFSLQGLDVLIQTQGSSVTPVIIDC